MDYIYSWLFGDEEVTHSDYFLSENHVNYVFRRITTIFAQNGRRARNVNDIRAQMEIWVLKEHDTSVRGDIYETVDFMNNEFINFVVRHNKVTANPMRDKIYGKKMSEYMPEDYRNMDVWSSGQQFTNASHQKTKMRGINNPHIIGAHRRHYDNTDEGIRHYEQQSLVPKRYNMSELL